MENNDPEKERLIDRIHDLRVKTSYYRTVPSRENFGELYRRKFTKQQLEAEITLGHRIYLDDRGEPKTGNYVQRGGNLVVFRRL